MGDGVPRSRWGRSRLGGGRWSALAVALVIGVVLAAGFGALAAATGVVADHPLLGGVVFAVCTVGPCAALGYLLAVDRDTIAGATRRPEESVESGWYERAAAGALGDVVVLAGLTLVVATFVPAIADLPLRLVLVVLIGVAAASCAVRYLVARRKG